VETCRAGQEKSCEFVPVAGKIRDYPEVGIKKCQECGIKIHARDIQERVSYESGSMWGHTPELLKSKIGYKLKEDARRASTIRQLCEKYGLEDVLDFGCGKGDLLELLKPILNVAGFEIESDAVSILRQRQILNYSSMSELIDSDEKFDLILAIHVLEHLTDPRVLIEVAEKKLKVGGFLVIETPNANDALLEKYDCTAFQSFTYWSHHPTLHTNESISQILLSSGFELILNSGIQRYSLRNHLHWLSRGKPGGHDDKSLEIFASIEDEYDRALIKEQTSDTIWVVAKRLN
jgi:2-polyprenyl-3-methyl-5-hydroxy-6-metoxy-1,4-benzoquinol methylase